MSLIIPLGIMTIAVMWYFVWCVKFLFNGDGFIHNLLVLIVAFWIMYSVFTALFL